MCMYCLYLYCRHVYCLAMYRLYRRWGDAQYAKGEYDAAMVQYGETIGHLEPSYVIRYVTLCDHRVAVRFV